jgi:hypothetical protein
MLHKIEYVPTYTCTYQPKQGKILFWAFIRRQLHANFRANFRVARFFLIQYVYQNGDNITNGNNICQIAIKLSNSKSPQSIPNGQKDTKIFQIKGLQNVKKPGGLSGKPGKLCYRSNGKWLGIESL